MEYIARKDTWFKEGTECKLIEDFGYNSGIFEGIFVIDEKNWLKVKTKWNNNKVGDEVIDREVCSFNEFIIKE